MFKTLWIAMVGVTLCGATYLAIANNNTSKNVGENSYQTFWQLLEKADQNKDSLVSREILADEIAERLFNAYRLSSGLDFTEETNYYYTVSAVASRRSVEKWRDKRWIGTARLHCSKPEQVAQISAPSPNGPKNFVYKVAKDLPVAPAPEEVEGEAICALGIHRNWWIGPELHQPEILRQRLEAGEWLGVAQHDGHECDVVMTVWRDNPWVFFVSRDGLLRLWLRIEKFKQNGSAYDTLIRVKSYTY